MRYFILITICQFFLSLSFGQKDEDEVFTIVEEIPVFENGSIDEFKKYVENRIKYPEEAFILGIEGKVFVKFLINFSDSLPRGKGRVDSIQIIESLHPLLDSVAFKIIESSPYWTAGNARGTPQNTWITIPISFKRPNIDQYYVINKNEELYKETIQSIDFNGKWNIHQIIVSGLAGILAIAPKLEDKGEIYFKINRFGYILEYQISEYKSECFRDFLEIYILSLPKINSKTNSYVTSEIWLKLSIESNLTEFKISPISIIDNINLSRFENKQTYMNCSIENNLINNPEYFDSIQTVTIINSQSNIDQSMTLYKSYPKYNINKKINLRYQNDELVESETIYSYKDSKNRQQEKFEYLIIFNSHSPQVSIKKINRCFRNQKNHTGAIGLTKIFTYTSKNEDTTRVHRYYSKLLSKKNWITISNNYIITINDSQKIEEGFQTTSGMETMVGDNSKIYKYYNNGDQMVCMIKSNEGSYTDVFFKENKKRYVLRISDVYNDFHNIFSTNINKETFEDYLNKNHLEYYYSMQIFDNSNRLLKEKFFEKSYSKSRQIERLIDYRFYDYSK